MTKKSTLSEAFSTVPKNPEPQPQVGGKTVSGNRAGKTAATAFIDPAGMTELKILAAKMRRTQQDLLVEAINDLLKKHGMMPLAGQNTET